MSVGRDTKDPAATESYGFDWSDDLATGDTISSSTWAFETAEGGATTLLTQAAASNTTTTTSIRVSGGVSGGTYYLKNTVVTAAGDTLVRRMLLDVERE